MEFETEIRRDDWFLRINKNTFGTIHPLWALKDGKMVITRMIVADVIRHEECMNVEERLSL